MTWRSKRSWHTPRVKAIHPRISRSHTVAHPDYPVLFHATTRPAMYSILKNGFDPSLSGQATKRRSGRVTVFGSDPNFGHGLYFSKAYDAETYGKYVIAAHLKPDARIFAAIAMPEDRPSYWDDVVDYYHSTVCQAYKDEFKERNGHEYTIADSASYLERHEQPWSAWSRGDTFVMSEMTAYTELVNKYARHAGYDGIDWESEVVIWNPDSIASIEKGVPP